MEAVEAFKDFKASVENVSGYKLCKVMTDNAHKCDKIVVWIRRSHF